MKLNKDLWLLEFGDWFWIQFNWEDFGWRLGIEYDSETYSRSIQFVVFKPSISFGYVNKITRDYRKEKK
jgi:hypothetical protein